jgi:DNA-binding transcriptional regulator YiaG
LTPVKVFDKVLIKKGGGKVEIRNLREDLHMSHDEFAYEAGVTGQTVRNWEKADKTIDDTRISLGVRRNLHRLQKRIKQ